MPMCFCFASTTTTITTTTNYTLTQTHVDVVVTLTTYTQDKGTECKNRLCLKNSLTICDPVASPVAPESTVAPI